MTEIKRAVPSATPKTAEAAPAPEAKNAVKVPADIADAAKKYDLGKHVSSEEYGDGAGVHTFENGSIDKGFGPKLVVFKNNDVYVVKAGDTLSKIAKQHHTTTDDLAIFNGIENQNLIKVGQKIVVGHNRVVTPGDNLTRISEYAGTTVDKLAQMNGLKDPNKLSVGQVIKTPIVAFGC